LVNGVLGSFDFTDEEWLGFQETNFEAVIDLEKTMSISQIIGSFLVNQGSWIFCPEKVEFFGSDDGENYNLIKVFSEDAEKKDDKHHVRKFIADFQDSNIRYIKIKANNIQTCPDWHTGAGGKAWLFVDEIIVN